MTVPAGFGSTRSSRPPAGRSSSSRPVGRQRGGHEGDVDGRQRRRPATTRSSSSSRSRRREDVHVPGRADVFGRVDRGLVGPGVVGGAGADDRGEELARRRRLVDADDHRAGRGAARALVAGGLRCSSAVGKRARSHEAGGAVRARPGRGVAALAALPGAASAHAYLVKTVPAASGVLNAPPPNVAADLRRGRRARFAIISVTDADGEQETTVRHRARRRIPTRWSCRCARIWPRAGT